MLTVAYCRVSTEEQAAEGFSIEGQADKLTQYATLMELGDVLVVEDPGRSGKDMDRPGLQKVLAMVADGNVSHVLVWRLDRLSRNLGDLLLLADEFGQAGVGLHSFSEKLDLSSATGRMFYNILGTFAQFYREQLAENVTMGMDQARAEGRWVNRPPTGYQIVDGALVANDQAPIVQRIFKLRGAGASQGDIAAATGINYSTVGTILRNRAYLGEMRHKDRWLPGRHEPLITRAEWDAAHRGRTPGQKRGRDLLSGRVRCGICRRRMSIMGNGKGQKHYRCRHQGDGCTQPARSNRGLLAAFVLALSLLCDGEIRQAIRDDLAERRQRSSATRRRRPNVVKQLEKLDGQRQKLLKLHYDDKISADQFGHEQARITLEMENLQAQADDHARDNAADDDLADRFEEVAALLDNVDLEELWDAAETTERRALVDELLADVTVYPDRLQVTIHGAPPLNVGFEEVGLKAPADSKLSGVGGGT